MLLSALRAVETAASSACVTDRGHRHSDGKSEVHFWFRPLCDAPCSGNGRAGRSPKPLRGDCVGGPSDAEPSLPSDLTEKLDTTERTEGGSTDVLDDSAAAPLQAGTVAVSTYDLDVYAAARLPFYVGERVHAHEDPTDAVGTVVQAKNGLYCVEYVNSEGVAQAFPYFDGELEHVACGDDCPSPAAVARATPACRPCPSERARGRRT